MREIENIVIHCSATKPNQDIGVKQIRAWHIAKGWRDIGYHFLVRRSGKIEIGRPINVAGAHVKYHNKTSIGICYAGGVDEKGKPTDNRTNEQKQSMQFLVSFLWAMFPDAEVLGHCDFPGVEKACPCFNVKEWVDTFGCDSCSCVTECKRCP